MKGYRNATFFLTMIIIGIPLSIFLGKELDAFFHTTPWMMLIMLGYVVIGSLVLLVKTAGGNHGK